MSDVEISAEWKAVKTAPRLGDGDVHVWRFALDRPASELAELATLLDDEERRRAARFVRAEVGSRFTAGRGLLRTILAPYLSMAPAAIRFAYNGYGKPSLAEPIARGSDASGRNRDVRFNLSHSGEWALLAIAGGREVGVDIEAIRPELRFEQLAEHFFSSSEVATLLATPDEQRRRAFFACWTRKEAYIKALGRGLSVPLDSFDVSLAPNTKAELLQVRDLPLERSRWLIVAFDPADDYLGALCVERPVTTVWQGNWGA